MTTEIGRAFDEIVAELGLPHDPHRDIARIEQELRSRAFLLARRSLDGDLRREARLLGMRLRSDLRKLRAEIAK